MVVDVVGIEVVVFGAVVDDVVEGVVDVVGVVDLENPSVKIKSLSMNLINLRRGCRRRCCVVIWSINISNI